MSEEGKTPEEIEREKRIEEELSKPTEAQRYVEELGERSRYLSDLEYQIPATPREGLARSLKEKVREVTDTASLLKSDKSLWDLLASGEVDPMKLYIMEMARTDNFLRQMLMLKMMGGPLGFSSNSIESIVEKAVNKAITPLEQRIDEIEKRLKKDEESKLVEEVRKELKGEIDELKKLIKASKKRKSIKAYIDKKFNEILNIIKEKGKPEEVSEAKKVLEELKEYMKELVKKGEKEEVKEILKEVKEALKGTSSIKEAIGLIKEIKETFREHLFPQPQSPRTTTQYPAIYEGKLPIWLHPDAITGTKEFVKEVVGAVTEEVKEIIRTYFTLKGGVPEIGLTKEEKEEVETELPEI